MTPAPTAPVDFAALRARLAALRDEKAQQSEVQRQSSRRLTALDAEQATIQQQLAAQVTPLPRVSDHALIQYLRRRFDFDVDAVRAEVLPTDARTLAAIATLGNGTYPVGDSHRIVVKGNTVVTVLPFD
ncbi:MAG: hypothetical protein NVS3B25_19080 [Hymenobacter sp.]